MHRTGEIVAQNRRDSCTENVRQLHRTGETVAKMLRQLHRRGEIVAQNR